MPSRTSGRWGWCCMSARRGVTRLMRSRRCAAAAGRLVKARCAGRAGGLAEEESPDDMAGHDVHSGGRHGGRFCCNGGSRALGCTHLCPAPECPPISCPSMAALVRQGCNLPPSAHAPQPPHCAAAPLCLQPSLIMKILRGRYEPVLGLSTDLTAIINRCLSQAAARRPSAERLLSLPCVRAKAAELGIELPASVLAAPPASPGGSFILGEGPSPRKRSVLPSLQAVADARRSSNGGVAGGNGRPTARRATCPHSPAVLPLGVDRPPRPVVARRSTPHIVFAERQLTGAERHNLRMKPPLPAAAVPRRRRTEQAAAAGRQARLGSLQGESVLNLQGMAAAPAPASPLQAGFAAALAAAAAAAAQPLALEPAQDLLPATPPAAASPSGALQAVPRRHSHFSVTHAGTERRSTAVAVSAGQHQWQQR